MSVTVLELKDPAAMSDEELASMSPVEFVQSLLDRAAAFGTVMMDKRNYRIEPLSPEEKQERLAEWNRRHAWLEWWLGVAPPSKEIVVLPDDDYPLKVRISQQIIDEVKHQRVFAQRAKALGGDPRLERYEPPAAIRAMYDYTFDFPDILDIAVSLQCTGEAVLLHHCNPEHSIQAAVVDEGSLQAVAEDVLPDEPRHIKNGEDILKKYCNTPAKRRRAYQVQDIKLRTLFNHYLVDHELLGAYWIGPTPTIGGRPLR